MDSTNVVTASWKGSNTVTKSLRNALATLVFLTIAWVAFRNLDNQFLLTVKLAQAVFLNGDRTDCGTLHLTDDAKLFRQCLQRENVGTTRDSVGVFAVPVFEGRAYKVVLHRTGGDASIFSWSSRLISLPHFDACAHFSFIVDGSVGAPAFPSRKIHCQSS